MYLSNNLFILDGQDDTILDYINKQYVISNQHEQSLENTLSTFTFIAIGDKRYTEYLGKRNGVIAPGEDGELLEFRIFESDKYRDTEGLKVQVFTRATYLDLKTSKIIDPHKTNAETAEQHANLALQNTEWQAGNIGFKGVRTITFDNYTNPYAYLQRIAREFELELHFYVTTNGQKVTGRYVDLIDRIGEFRGRTVEFGRDLQGIRRKEDTSNVVTALRGIGPEKEDGTRLEVFIEDLEALERWGRKGKHILDVYEPQSNRQDMTIEELEQYTRTELNKRINAVINYDVEIVDLENVPGMENKKIRFADTIRIKDTKFEPPLYLEARIFNQKRDVFTKANKTVELGDYVEFTEDEVKAVWKQLREQIRNKISQAELEDYTYNKNTIDDKDGIVFEDGKTFAEAVGIDAKEYAEVQDDLLKIGVEQYADDVADQTLLDAKAYAVAQEIYDNKMQSIADDLADRTTIGYVDGQLVDKANVNDVYTISDVDNMINNTVSVTQYTTDMDGVVTDLTSHGTRIGQNESAIGLKASQTELNAVEGRISTAEGTLSILPTQIEAKVDRDGVIASINVSPEFIKLDADRIEFTGHIFGQGATFEGDILGGSIKSNTTINVTTDLWVGNNIYLGKSEEVDDKEIVFYEDDLAGIKAYKDSYGNSVLLLNSFVMEIDAIKIDLMGLDKFESRVLGTDFKVHPDYGNAEDATWRFDGKIQASGNDVDTIVEQGSNANGEYIRYANGIQICWNTMSSTSNANGGIVYTWTFPKPFINGQYHGNCMLGTASYLDYGITAQRSSNSITFRGLGVGGTTSYTASLYAIGRWKP